MEEALSRTDGDNWRQTVSEELSPFEENEAWKAVNVLNNGTVVKCKWVFNKKFDSDNRVRYRARLDAKGFDQKPGVAYDEVYSPGVKHSTLRFLLHYLLN